MTLPAALRDALPLGLRRRLRLVQRALGDLLAGCASRRPARIDVSSWPIAASVRQDLATTPNSDAKRHNIALAAPAFSARPIPPNGIFSFWVWLGAPSSARGFQDGRALRGDSLVLEAGGGLCQLAGAIYYAGLQAGLTPVERHAHSADLYTDDTRYAPLGSDATVSYGFKDLRFRNSLTVPVAFEIDADATTLAVTVRSQQAIRPLVPEFRRLTPAGETVAVETWVDGKKIASTVYKKPAR